MPTRDEILALLIEQQKEILDRLDRMDAASTLDPWDQDFDLDGGSLGAPAPTVAGRPTNKEGVEPKTVELPKDWDDDDAWNEEQRSAYLRHIADKGVPAGFEKPAEWVEIQMAGGIGAQFPKPSPEALAAWDANADAICENFSPDPERGTALSPKDCADYYRKGGPLWLAAYDHEFVMGLPMPWRQAMVREVNTYAPQSGMELGRDILRADTESQQGYALDRVEEFKAKVQRG